MDNGYQGQVDTPVTSGRRASVARGARSGASGANSVARGSSMDNGDCVG